MVHVSSDYVFDGARRKPYLESDATGPLSAYGRTKLAGEQTVARAAPESHTVVRSSWLFGAEGHCFPKTIRRLAAERDELSIVADQVGSPDVHRSPGAGAGGAGRRAFPGRVHVAANEQCSWYEFAQAIVDGADLDCRSGRSRRRSTRSGAATGVQRAAASRGAPQLPSWREGLTEFSDR